MNAPFCRPATGFDRDYEGAAISLRAARADVVSWLSGRGANDDDVERAALIVSELATNALQATPGRPYHINVCPVDEHLVDIAVRNGFAGGLPPPRSQWKPADVLAHRGRGLSIVEALSDVVTVEVSDDYVVVRARIRTTATR